MGQQTAAFEQQSADDGKHRCPAGTGAVGDADVSLFYATNVSQVGYDTRDIGCAPYGRAESAQSRCFTLFGRQRLRATILASAFEQIIEFMLDQNEKIICLLEQATLDHAPSE